MSLQLCFTTSKALQQTVPLQPIFFNEIEPNYNSMFTTETFCKYFGLGGRQRKRMKTALEYALNLRLPGSTVRAIRLLIVSLMIFNSMVNHVH